MTWLNMEQATSKFGMAQKRKFFEEFSWDCIFPTLLNLRMKWTISLGALERYLVRVSS